MKKIVYLVLCVLFALSSVVWWNWSPDIAKWMHVGVNVSDMFIVVLLFASLVFSGLYVEEGRKKYSQCK